MEQSHKNHHHQQHDPTSMNTTNGSLDALRWNTSTYQQSSYASQYPYTVLDDKYLQHVVNFTIAKADGIFANATSFNFNNELHIGNNSTSSDVMHFDCNAAHENDESGWFSTEFQATLHFMYITIFIIAILGNGMVCFIVCQSSRMQTVTNYFIANLAVADMSMAFFCIPFSFISQFVLQ
jgi:hypothetical protein